MSLIATRTAFIPRVPRSSSNVTRLPSDNGEKYFFHITQAPAAIAEGNRVTFELERGTRGMNAVRVAISDK